MPRLRGGVGVGHGDGHCRCVMQRSGSGIFDDGLYICVGLIGATSVGTAASGAVCSVHDGVASAFLRGIVEHDAGVGEHAEFEEAEGQQEGHDQREGGFQKCRALLILQLSTKATMSRPVPESHWMALISTKRWKVRLGNTPAGRGMGGVTV